MVHCNTGGLISISFLELITRDRTMRVDRRRSQEDVKTTPCDGDSHSSLHAQLTALSPVLARQRQISCLTVIPLDRIWPVSDSKTNCVIDYTTHKLRLSGVARNSCFFFEPILNIRYMYSLAARCDLAICLLLPYRHFVYKVVYN